MLERVIFAIDNDDDVHTVAKFMRHVDTLRAMNTIEPVEMLVGCYKGNLERSYMMRSDQFDHVSDYVKYQESFLLVPGDTRQPCVLEFPVGNKRVAVGKMRQVSAKDALQSDAWTYSETKGKYFVCG